ncbi:MAG: hypothetical protein WC375_09180 [Methanomassiliicoccales archaeon]|jgi:hypothetical protein
MAGDKNAPVVNCGIRPCVGANCINRKECQARLDGRANGGK